MWQKLSGFAKWERQEDIENDKWCGIGRFQLLNCNNVTDADIYETL